MARLSRIDVLVKFRYSLQLTFSANPVSGQGANFRVGARLRVVPAFSERLAYPFRPQRVRCMNVWSEICVNGRVAGFLWVPKQVLLLGATIKRFPQPYLRDNGTR